MRLTRNRCFHIFKWLMTIWNFHKRSLVIWLVVERSSLSNNNREEDLALPEVGGYLTSWKRSLVKMMKKEDHMSWNWGWCWTKMSSTQLKSAEWEEVHPSSNRWRKLATSTMTYKNVIIFSSNRPFQKIWERISEKSENKHPPLTKFKVPATNLKLMRWTSILRNWSNSNGQKLPKSF